MSAAPAATGVPAAKCWSGPPTRAAGHRPHQKAGAPGPGAFTGREDRRRGGLVALHLHLLHEPPVVAHRIEAQGRQLRADVGRRNPLVARAAAASVEGVAGKEPHVGGDATLEEGQVDCRWRGQRRSGRRRSDRRRNRGTRRAATHRQHGDGAAHKQRSTQRGHPRDCSTRWPSSFGRRHAWAGRAGRPGRPSPRVASTSALEKVVASCSCTLNTYARAARRGRPEDCRVRRQRPARGGVCRGPRGRGRHGPRSGDQRHPRRGRDRPHAAPPRWPGAHPAHAAAGRPDAGADPEREAHRGRPRHGPHRRWRRLPHQTLRVPRAARPRPRPHPHGPLTRRSPRSCRSGTCASISSRARPRARAASSSCGRASSRCSST